jgi:rRNA processing protein Gar1
MDGVTFYIISNILKKKKATMAKRWQGKRRQWQMGDELEQVDDLAFAAQFAVPPVLAQVDDVKDDTTLQNDADEIDVDDQDSDESSEASNKDNEKKDDDGDSSDEDDDDESDVDLIEAMAKMQDDDEDGPPSSAPPKTEHELDLYRTPMEELEKHLEVNLTVEEQDRLRLGGSTTTSTNISLAGIVRNCMVQDRTLIVESAPGTRPLDEGSLLVIRLTTNDLCLIPLGRIFEVFGPVSQPLYTIRLPPAPTVSKPKKKQGAETTKAPAVKPKQEATAEVPSQEIPQDSAIASDTANMSDESNPLKESLDESPRVEENQSEPQAPLMTNEDSQNTPSAEEQMKEDTPAGSKLSDMETGVVSKDIPGQDSTPVAAVDPWAADGEYIQIIKSNDQVSVYFVVDEAKLIDTGAIIRKSGKGCGKYTRKSYVLGGVSCC